MSVTVTFPSNRAHSPIIFWDGLEGYMYFLLFIIFNGTKGMSGKSAVPQNSEEGIGSNDCEEGMAIRNDNILFWE